MRATGCIVPSPTGSGTQGSPRALSRSENALALVLVLDLALGDFLHGHGQVVLRARLDERGRRFLEAHALTELMVVVVDLAGALRGDDDQRIARVDMFEQLVDAGMDHGAAIVAARASSVSTSAL